MKRFLSELRRRRVLRVAGVYLVTAWAAIEVADVIFPRLGLPDWTVTFVVALAFIGFPVAVILAWAFDITPDGIRQESPGQHTSRVGRPPAAWLGLGILIGLVGFGGYAYITGPSESADVELDAGRIAVLPFEVRAGPDLQYLGEAFVDLLSAKLHDAGELSSVDPAALLGQLSADTGAPLDPDQAQRVALRFGAGYFVLGSILRLGDDLEIQARLYDADRDVVAAATVTTPESGLTGAVDDLARQLLADRLKGPGAELTRIAAAATASLPALKSYLQGEARLRRGDAEGAVAAFEEAITSDSTFTYAWFRLAVARSWMPRSSSAYAATEDAIAAAMAGAPGLPERERTLVRLFDAYWAGGSVVAEELAWRILSAQPENLDARYYLGEVLFHGAAGRGRDIQEARDPLERTLALQPDHAFALVHLVDLALARGDAPAVDSLGLRLTALSPELAPQVAAYRAVLTDGADPTRPLALALDDVPGEIIADIAWRATALTRRPDVAEAFARVLESSTRSPAIRQAAAEMLAGTAAAEGRWDHAMSLLEPYLDSPGATTFAAQLVLSGGDAAPRESRRLLANRLDEGQPAEDARAGDAAPANVVRTYLAARLALSLGDAARYTTAYERLRRLAQNPGRITADPRDRATYHLTALRAHRAAAEGRASDAIAVLQSPAMESMDNEEGFLLADLLADQGRSDLAERWYRALPEFQSEVYTVLPLLAVGGNSRTAR